MRSLRRPLSSAAVVFAWVVALAELMAGSTRAADTPGAERVVFTLSSHVQRVVVARIPNGADLLAGLQEAAKKEGLKNAAIVSGAGSLTSYHLHAVGNTTFPPKNVYTKGQGPWDLLSVTGYVIDGRIHAHVTVVDDKRAFGGHLEPGTRVFTFAIVTFAELEEGASLGRFDDWNWGGEPEALRRK